MTPDARQIGSHHRHDADRERHFELVVAEPRAIADRSIGEKRRIAGVDSAQEPLASAHVQVALRRAGKRSFRQVLGGGGRANRHLDLAAQASAQALIGVENRCPKLPGQWRFEHGRPCGLPLGGQFVEILRIQRGEDLAQPSVEVIRGEQQAISLSRRRKTIERANPHWREGAEELAKRGILAADTRHVLQRDLEEVEHVLGGHGVLQSNDLAAPSVEHSVPSSGAERRN